MKMHKLFRRGGTALLAALLAMSILAGCAQKPLDEGTVPQTSQTEATQAEQPGSEEPITFRPADIGMPAMPQYDFPYMGMTAVLTAPLLEKIQSQEAVLLPDAAYQGDGSIRYAQLQLYTLTPEQNQPVTAFDLEAWKAELGSVGAFGVYHTDTLEELDTLTGCTNHRELGKSDDGAYTYFISLADGEETLKKELDSTAVTLTEMVALDPYMGGDAFSEARQESANVGDFTTTDINGNEYTKSLFQDYDLTLVNVFATWCSPCVSEMPELQKLKETMAEQGVNVAAVVLDSVTDAGTTDSNAVDMAKLLQDRLGLTFPLLMPDETKLNGRLKGITGVPESFFVDSQGNIVGETYVGARSYDDWKSIVETELANLQAANS